MAKSRFRPRDPDAVHKRFEEIKSRVIRRMDDEWQRLVRAQPRGDVDRDERPMPAPAPRVVSRKRP
jgi:hypothetical protein